MCPFCSQSRVDTNASVNYHELRHQNNMNVDPMTAEAPVQVVTMVQEILDQHHHNLRTSTSRLMHSPIRVEERLQEKIDSIVSVVQHLIARKAHQLLNQFASQVLENVVPIALVLERQRNRAIAASPSRIPAGWTRRDNDRWTRSEMAPVNSRDIPLHVGMRDDPATTQDTLTYRQPSHAGVNGWRVQCQGHTDQSRPSYVVSDDANHRYQNSPTPLAQGTTGIFQDDRVVTALSSRLWSGLCGAFRRIVAGTRSLTSLSSNTGGPRRIRHILTEEAVDEINDLYADMRSYFGPLWEAEHSSDAVLHVLADFFEDGRMDGILDSQALTGAE